MQSLSSEWGSRDGGEQAIQQSLPVRDESQVGIGISLFEVKIGSKA